MKSDLELVAESRGGNRESMALLYGRHYDLCIAVAMSCVRNKHDAEDLVAEVFTCTLRALRNGRGPEGSFRAYLCVAIRHRAAAISAERKREMLVDDFDSNVVSITDAASTRAERDVSTRAFGTLPRKWQEVLWLVDVEGFSGADASKILGTTASAGAAMLHRARAGLREAFLVQHATTACLTYREQLARMVRRGETSEHTESCEGCSASRLELAVLNAQLG